VRIFVPIMRAQNEPCHIVNTASIAGLISPPGLSVYRTNKFAVVGFSESLYHELAEQAPQIGISVLVPGMVKTDILSSAQCPGQVQGDVREEQRLRQALEAAMPPEAVADLVLEAVREEHFYILTHPERNWQIRNRVEDILLGRNPTGTVAPSPATT
jgi:short-subunit dehydrogenase